MSEDSLRFLQSEVSRLQKELADVRAEAKSYRIKAKEARAERDAKQAELDDLLAKAGDEFDSIDEQLAALQDERDEWKQKAEMSPGEVGEKVRALEAEIRNRDIKEKFNGITGELADGLSLDDLFKLHGFDPSAVDPAELKVDDLVKGWREAKPGTFKPAQTGQESSPGGTQRPTRPAPLTVPEGSSRGGRDTASHTVTIPRSMMREPGWMTKNKAEAAAYVAGEYVLSDD